MVVLIIYYDVQPHINFA